MKIVFVTKGYYSAAKGAESAARDWYQKISERADVSLVTDKMTVIGRYIRRGHLSFLVSGNPATFLIHAISQSRALKKVCKEVKPDLVHIHSYSGYIAIAPPGIPTVVTFHDEPFVKITDYISPAPIRFVSSIIRFAEDFMQRLIQIRRPYVHAISSTISTLLKEKYPSIKTCIIPNPHFITSPSPPSKSKEQLLEQLGIPSDARIILTVGHVVNRKAVHKILDASIELAGSKGIYFVVVGGASNFVSRAYFKEIEKRAKAHQSSNFSMTGYLDEKTLHNLFCHSDVFLSVSQSEACNLALIEAASYGLPIITTNVGAAKDLFLNEALFLDRNCTGHEIALAISEKLGSSRINYSALKGVTWENAMEDLFEFYSKILDL